MARSRVTPSDIERFVARLRQATGLPLRVDWSNGRPRVYQVINPETDLQSCRQDSSRNGYLPGRWVSGRGKSRLRRTHNNGVRGARATLCPPHHKEGSSNECHTILGG